MKWKTRPYCNKALGRERVECQLCSKALEPSTGDAGGRPSPSQRAAATGRPYSETQLNPERLSPWPQLKPSQSGPRGITTITQSAGHPIRRASSPWPGGQPASVWRWASPQTPHRQGLLTRLTAHLGGVFRVPFPQTLCLQMGKPRPRELGWLYQGHSDSRGRTLF